MATLRRKALAAQQGGWRIYLTTLPAKDLRGFTTIDRYDPGLPVDDPRQGYQRPADRSRLRRFGNFLIKAEYPISPTALLLSSRNGGVKFNPDTQEVTLNSNTPLQLVDGQHRAEGFSYAVHDKGADGLGLFDVPVVIVEGLDKLGEMDQFRIVNGTVKSVKTDLVNMLLTQKQSQRGDEAIPEKEQWKVVIARVIELLNTQPDSAWYKRIIMPNQSSWKQEEVAEDPSRQQERVVRATSFMTSLKPIYDDMVYHRLLKSGLTDQANKVAKVIFEYWKAVEELMPEAFASPEEYVLQKTPGLFALHRILRDILPIMLKGERGCVRSEFKIMLKPCPDLNDANYWLAKGDGAARYGSMKGFAELADSIWEAREQAVAEAFLR